MRRPAPVAPLSFLCCAALALLASPGFAAWPHDPNAGNLPVCTAANDQFISAIMPDGAGGAFITWYDLRSGAYHIYAQRVNAAGVPLWTANGVVICNAVGSQYSPTIASDGAGGAIITWYDGRNGSNYDIYAQRVNGAGVTQWTVNGVAICVATGNQYSPTIAPDAGGGALITWQDGRNGLTYDIYAQHVNAAGVPLWTADGMALCAAVNNQYAPMIVSDGSGGAIVTWYDYRTLSTYDIYAQRVTGAGVPQWTADGVAISTAANDQLYPAIVSDGVGGGIITWTDYRSGIADIYAQRVNGAGVTQWIPNGSAVSLAANTQANSTIASDGAGGAIVTWMDYRGGVSSDIYAQRMTAAGVASWTTDGVAISAATAAQQSPLIASDGEGGAIITWQDYRNGSTADIFAQRVNANGGVQWMSDGVAVCTALNAQVGPVIASDGGGGAIIAWQDSRGGNQDIFAQRVESFGYLGSPEPAITSVRDVPNDQGGHVKVSWAASYLDAPPYTAIDSYWILRSAPPNVVTRALRDGAQLLTDVTAEPRPGARAFLALPGRATDYAWEYVASQPAFHVSIYSYVAPTANDSVGGANPRTAFMIMARTPGGMQWWFSAPDSGYSVDNLPPGTPAPFAAAYASGATHLHWGANVEADLAGYRLYRGSSSGFVPGPGNLVIAQPDTGYDDPGAAGSWYKLSAVDSHGNESPFAILGPDGTTGVTPPDATVALFLTAPAPNPVRGDGATFQLGLPAQVQVSLVLFDQQGRRVRELVRGVLPPGAHSIHWDGRDESGHAAPSGMYFARLQTVDPSDHRAVTAARFHGGRNPGRSVNVRFALVR